MQKLKDKVAVITGGTSGMALATAKLFVEEGAFVFITGRHKERLPSHQGALGFRWKQDCCPVRVWVA
jgi:NADP-dependent 3-hydroxy acid dehydrogenase YdfG